MTGDDSGRIGYRTAMIRCLVLLSALAGLATAPAQAQQAATDLSGTEAALNACVAADPTQKACAQLLLDAAKLALAVPDADRAKAYLARASLALGRLSAENGMLAFRQNQPDEAIAHWTKALDALREGPPEGLADVAVIAGNIGFALVEQGRATEAEPYLRESLAVLDAQAKPATDILASTLSSLARAYDAQSRRDEGTAIWERLAQLDLDQPLDDPVERGNRYLNLADRLESAGKFDIAASLYRGVLALERGDGTLPPASGINIRIRLARLLAVTGPQSEAETLQREALAMLDKDAAADPKAVLAVLDGLIDTLKGQSRAVETVPYIQRAAALRDRSDPVTGLPAGLRLSKLGGQFADAARFDLAEQAYRGSLAAIQGNPRASVGALATAFGNVGFALLSQSRIVEAEPFMRRELALREQDDDPKLLAATLDSLATALADRKPEEALNLARRALALREAEKDNWNLPSSYSLVGSLLAKVGQGEAGIASYRRGIAILERPMDIWWKPDRIKVYAADMVIEPEWLATLYSNLGVALEAAGRMDDALVEHRKALRLRRALYAASHPDRILANWGVARLLVRRPDGAGEARALLREAGQAMVARLAGYADFGATARDELALYRPVFRDQVKAAWGLSAAR